MQAERAEGKEASDIVVCDNGTGVRYFHRPRTPKPASPLWNPPPSLYLGTLFSRTWADPLCVRVPCCPLTSRFIYCPRPVPFATSPPPLRSPAPAQFVKCGFAGENFPRHMFPSLVGRPMLRAEEEVLDNVEIKVRGEMFARG